MNDPLIYRLTVFTFYDRDILKRNKIALFYINLNYSSGQQQKHNGWLQCAGSDKTSVLQGEKEVSSKCIQKKQQLKKSSSEIQKDKKATHSLRSNTVMLR